MILYFFIIFNVLAISFRMSSNGITYSTSDLQHQYLFHQDQLIGLILLCSFLRLIVMLILVWKEIMQDKVYIFQDTYSKSC